MDQTALAMARRFRELAEGRLPGELRDMRIYGSFARNEQRPTSDLDVFVLVNHLDRSRRRLWSDLAFAVMLEFSGTLDLNPLVMSESHFDELLRRERKLALDIVAEGRPV